MPARPIVFALFLVAAPLATPTLADSGTRGSGQRGSGARPAPASNADVQAKLAKTVWTYQGELTRGELDGQREATLSGQFRLEGEWVFPVEKEAEEAASGSGAATPEKAGSGRRGQGDEPTASRTPGHRSRFVCPPRDKKEAPEGAIGSFRVSKSGKLTIVFESEGGLNGAMTLTRKKRTEDTWIGSFREKEGKKTLRTWKMTVTTSEVE